ncbi:response regulator [Calothrix sp. CCY 0018]|uniref:response regulator n=1 Tax=Calothrix sp. CCY 0018 TaxID=3103864 RepID=UPI0039C63900
MGYRLNPIHQKASSTDSNSKLSKKLVSTVSPTSKNNSGATSEIESQESQPRLLIVGEDKGFIDTLVELATVRGLQTAIAHNPKLAKDSLQRVRPDIILLDISIDKKEDEFIFLEEISKQQPSIPVLVFTSEELSTDRVALARRKSQGFFHKPISSNRVLEVVTQTLSLYVIKSEFTMITFFLKN